MLPIIGFPLIGSVILSIIVVGLIFNYRSKIPSVGKFYEEASLGSLFLEIIAGFMFYVVFVWDYMFMKQLGSSTKQKTFTHMLLVNNNLFWFSVFLMVFIMGWLMLDKAFRWRKSTGHKIPFDGYVKRSGQFFT